MAGRIRALITLVLVVAAAFVLHDAAEAGTSCKGRTATIVGTKGSDIIEGTSGPDVIVGRGGNDIISGMGGNDLICGNGGNDEIWGGPGDDRIYGGGGSDRLLGNDGSDRLNGGKGWDSANGGSGTDSCRRTESDSWCEGSTATTTTSTGSPSLWPGSSGPDVRALQQELRRAKLYRGPIDGDYGPMTSQAVMAFHKLWGLDRSTTWSSSDWGRIRGWTPRMPTSRPGQSHRLEVNLSRQVVYLIEGGQVSAVMNASGGSGEYYTNSYGNWVQAVTPRGSYSLYRYYNGWETSYLGQLYKPWYFVGGYAIHGSGYVPAWGASHGCVRVPTWDADWLRSHLWIGMSIHVWD